MNIVRAVESDIVAVWHFVEAGVVKFGAVVWQDAQPILKEVEPLVLADLKAVILGLLVAFKGKSLADIEQGVLMVLEHAGSDLFAQAQELGSALLQVLIAEVQAA